MIASKWSAFRSIVEHQMSYISVWAVDHLIDHLSSDVPLAGGVNSAYLSFPNRFFQPDISNFDESTCWA